MYHRLPCNNTLLLIFIEEILKKFDPAHGVHNCGPVPESTGVINFVNHKLYNISKAHAVNDFFFSWTYWCLENGISIRKDFRIAIQLGSKMSLKGTFRMLTSTE